MKLIKLIASKISLDERYIKNIIDLIEEGSTIPFIARYRKDRTGNASDEVLREFEEVFNSVSNLLARQEEILKILTERELLTKDLEEKIFATESITKLEDIYRPYKEKRNTRAAKAIELGLEPLANMLQSGKFSKRDLLEKSKQFKVSSEEAIQGAKDILAERYADNPKEREVLRSVMSRHGMLEVKATKKMEEDSLYALYAGKKEKIAYVASHRFLAIARGVKEKELNWKVSIDLSKTEENIKTYKVKPHFKDSKEWIIEAYFDGLKRLLLPSIENEVLKEAKEKADRGAIETFGKNLTQLLMSPPITKSILGVDPAFRTGCKLAVLDENGKFLDSAVVYPTPPQNDFKKASSVIKDLVSKYNIEICAIGNGTASRETEEFFSKLNEEGLGLNYCIVSEAGASVYSASKLANEEFPELDVTIRGAISIARRVLDPMSELIKIDPKSLGIGQYQHDVDQKLLKTKLENTTIDIVNRVGVDLNSASYTLLSFISGIKPSVAKAIHTHGKFSSREDLKSVKGLGAKAYEQCAGFLKIRDGKEPLDNTRVHPESYALAREVLKNNFQVDVTKLAEKFKVSEITVKEVIKDLKREDFDPRDELPQQPFKSGVLDLESLKAGSVVSGVVRSIVDFGAFVDIGLKNDGMIHISKLGEKRVNHPLEVLSVNDYLPTIYVIDIDEKKGRVALSLVES